MAEPTDPNSYDGCIYWPTTNGMIIRVDPFHITSYGMCTGESGDKKGWVIWVNLTGGSQLQTFHETEQAAKTDFKRVQLAKTRH